jgi:hypothetical protein
MEHTLYYYSSEIKATFIACGRWRQNIDCLKSEKPIILSKTIAMYTANGQLGHSLE